MLQRFSFIFIGAFFVTMNFLLWRAEFSGGSRFGSPVPPEVVWRRILTAPDDSSLEIQRDGNRIGYCHWIAGAAEELVLETAPEMEGMPEGMVQRPTAYAVHVEGGILTGPMTDRLRFSLEMELSGEQEWREVTLRMGNRPGMWEIEASAVNRTVEVKYGQDESAWARRFTFEELKDPRRLLQELGGPLAAAVLPQLSGLSMLERGGIGVPWEARTDWMMVGGTRVQVYRLEARLWERHEVVVLISRVGEIMRVDLPGGLSLVNQVLANF